jgi:hypothetical protein
MPYPLVIAVLLLALTFAQPAEPGVVVALVRDGNLYLMNDAIGETVIFAGGDVIRPYLAPDGLRVAFTRGADGQAQTLWLDERLAGGGLAHELLSELPPTQGDGGLLLIDQVAWLDDATLLFNTYRLYPVGRLPGEDLWSLRVRDGGVLRRISRCGAFTLSPDRAWVACVQAGAYGGEAGSVRLINLASGEAVSTLSFPAISAASDTPFIPAAQWRADSAALHIAVPDPDLVYDDGALLTTLYRLNSDGTQHTLGTAQASFFGQPVWSPDGTELLYMRRTGGATSNALELISARGDGSDAQLYASAEVGLLELPRWLPGGGRFVYAQGAPDRYWLGQRGQPPGALPAPLYAPHFLDEQRYLFAVPAGEQYELRLGIIGSDSTRLLAALTTPYALLDARIR